jgi:5-methylcytosine-specific restriction protein B
VVICYESNPTKQILCLATVSKASDGERIYFKKVETLANGIDYATFKDVPELQQMECLVNPNGSFFKLTAEEYDVLMDIIRESNPIAPAKATKLYTKENFLEDVYISSSDYDALCGVLEHKKNIIFQGAPGVGKTFSAKRLAYSIMGEVDDDRIGFVQFHQNYSYEDFVMGYKPNSEGGFDLQRGIFYKFCIKSCGFKEV